MICHISFFVSVKHFCEVICGAPTSPHDWGIDEMMRSIFPILGPIFRHKNVNILWTIEPVSDIQSDLCSAQGVLSENINYFGCGVYLKISRGIASVLLTYNSHVWMIWLFFVMMLTASGELDWSRCQRNHLHKRGNRIQQHCCEGCRQILQEQEKAYYHHTNSKTSHLDLIWWTVECGCVCAALIILAQVIQRLVLHRHPVHWTLNH